MYNFAIVESNVYCALGEKVRIVVFISYEVQIFLKRDREFVGHFIKYPRSQVQDTILNLTASGKSYLGIFN